MRFTPEFLDEIKTRVAVSDVVGKRVRLKKEGREWRGLSPFNTEKTPSFFVNDAKMAWFDFSSGRNGNIFDFVMATDGLTFPEAVERLAGEAGLELPKNSAEGEARERRRAGLAEVLELSCLFFEASLAERGGARSRTYLAERGLAPEAQREFRLGYAPADRFALRDHLAGKGASVETMVEAGLLVHGEGIAVPYDRFRDRIMFPIADRSGRTIAFGGRALDPDVPAKYLNSPETPLFHKGAVLYNHHRARKAASDRGTVVVVEGYVDVIAMTSAGFPHVVAPLGTALTADQCELLWRMAPEPILCFDGDGAGRRAAFRAIDTVLPIISPSKTLRFAFLPEGEDPDDLARSGGKAAIEDVLGKARPLVDVLWMRETEATPLDTPERRAGLERRLGDLVRNIGDEALRRYYGAELRARMVGATSAAGKASVAPFSRSRAAGPFKGPSRGRYPFPAPPLRGYVDSTPAPISESLSRTFHLSRGAFARRELEILMLLLNHPDLLERHAEDLAHLELGHKDAVKLRDALVALSGEPPEDHRELKQALDRHGCGDLRARIEAAAERIPLWCMRPDAASADADLVLQQALALHRRAGELHRELKDAEVAFGNDATERNFARIRDLQGLVSAIEGTEASVEGFGTLSGHKSPEI